MLKVYFTASTSINGELKPNYQAIIDEIQKNNCELVSGQQIINSKLLAADKTKSKKEIFEREKKLIDQSDCILAEVTKPSLGVGAEVEHALSRGKPVLALVLEKHENLLSPIIAGNPSENLFIDLYNMGKLPYAVRDFLQHIQTVKRKKGTLIVIDGNDGSGKTIQANLLVSYLKRNNYPTKYMDFPQYYTSFHGNTVGKFLRGEFGKIGQVSPYLASLAYALDRASAKREMEGFLTKGGYIVANRYATSNMAHQGAKFSSENKREEFLKWVYDLEYKVHKIPREDIVIYLFVPYQIAQTLNKKKKNRSYLSEASKDIHENDRNYLMQAEAMYLRLAKIYKHWVRVDCVESQRILSPEEIHIKVLEILKERKLLL